MNIGKMIGDVEREIAAEDRREAPRRERMEKLRQSTPRVIYRDSGDGWMGGGRASYKSLRLGDLRYQPAHVETYSSFGDRTQRKRKRPTAIAIQRGGSSFLTPPEKLGEYVRRPTAKALRRLEEAEAALAAARRAVKDAERAAFTYGKPVPISAVQAATRAHRAAWDEGE